MSDSLIFVDIDKLSKREKSIYNRTDDILSLAGVISAEVKEVYIAKEIISSDNTNKLDGLWKSEYGRIVISRHCLKSFSKYAGALLYVVCSQIDCVNNSIPCLLGDLSEKVLTDNDNLLHNVNLSGINWYGLDCRSQLETVDIYSFDDLLKPLTCDQIKEALCWNIECCNISYEAFQEIADALGSENIYIDIGDIKPDLDYLPITFKNEVDDCEYDDEHQRALNYASWWYPILMQKAVKEITGESEPINAFPDNLYSEILRYDVQGYERLFKTDQMRKLAVAEINNLLGTLPEEIELFVRLKYEFNLDFKVLLKNLIEKELPESVIWSIGERFNRKASRGRRMLSHPSRSKKLEMIMGCNEVVENNNGRVIDELVNDYLIGNSINIGSNDEQNCYLAFNKIADLLYRDMPVYTIFNLINLTNLEWRKWVAFPVNLLRNSIIESVLGSSEIKIKSAISTDEFIILVSICDNDYNIYTLLQINNGKLVVIDAEQNMIANLYQKACQHLVSDTEMCEERAFLKIMSKSILSFCEYYSINSVNEADREIYILLKENYRLKRNKMHLDIFQTPIEDLDLSFRSQACLRRVGINNVGDLVSKSEDEVINIRNLGKRGYDEIREKLYSLDLGFADEDW